MSGKALVRVKLRGGMGRKRVHFFELRPMMQQGTPLAGHKAQDWSARIHKWLDDNPDLRVFKVGELDTVVEGVDGCLSQFALGRILTGDTGLRAGSLAGHFRAIKLDSEEDFFTRVNFVQFIPEVNAFAILGATRDAPNFKAVAALADTVAPLENDGRWIAAAITNEAEVERLNRSQQARKIEMTERVFPDSLFDNESTSDDMASWAQAVARSVGAEVQIRVAIRVVKPAKNPMGTRHLMDFFKRGKDRILNPDLLKITSVDPNEEGLIDLVVHNLTAYVDLPDLEEGTDVDAYQVSVLDALKSVIARRESQIRQLLRPGS